MSKIIRKRTGNDKMLQSRLKDLETCVLLWKTILDDIEKEKLYGSKIDKDLEKKKNEVEKRFNELAKKLKKEFGYLEINLFNLQTKKKQEFQKEMH